MQRHYYYSPLILTTMAIIENMWLRKSKKRLGGAVLYQAMEQTRIRELASSVTNPRTSSQMGQRVKWANLVNFYRANSNWMKYAYETKTPQQTEYNKFMSLNVSSSSIYLTKQQASAGSSVVGPYIMTQGSLGSIEFESSDSAWLSNIYYPQGSALLSTTTISEFSRNLIRQNPAIREGDQLSFIRFTQMFNSDTGNPYVIVRRYEIIIDSSSAALVGSYLPLDYIGVRSDTNPGRLIVNDSGQAGGFIMCLSRTIGGKTYVSSQQIILANMANILQQFSSQEQLAASIASYGENSDAFLSTTTADVNNQAPTPLAIVGFETRVNVFVPGQSVPVAGNITPGGQVSILFNDSLEGLELGTANIVTNRKAVTVTSPAIDGAAILGVVNPAAIFEEGEYLVYITARVGGNVYLAQFTDVYDSEN